MAEKPSPHPDDVPGIVAALMATGTSRAKATTIALHVRMVLWPAMAAARKAAQ